MQHDKVAILMGTYNGDRFLAEQIDSIVSQSHKNWILVVSDDGSVDKTQDILSDYKVILKDKIEVRNGPKRGFSANFMSMLCDHSIVADYFCFADQDDVWLDKKIEHALKKIEYEKTPALYCGRTWYVTHTLNKIGVSPAYIHPKIFRNALIQSVAGGNTMLLNKAARDIILDVGLVEVPSHDWWVYQLVTGVSGKVLYDLEPMVLYRQHESNIVGKKTSIIDRIERVRMVFDGQFKNWNDKNIVALNKASKHLSYENKLSLNIFETMRKARFKDRFRLLEVAGLYRQTMRGTLSLIVAALFRKI